jgi:hypothetical protein
MKFLATRIRLRLAELLTPWRMVKALREENELLVKTIAEPLLTGINIGNGTIDIGMQGVGPQLLAGMFIGMLDDPRAKNYVECHLYSPKHGQIVVTVQRCSGQTPHQLLEAARKEISALRSKRFE